MDGWVYPPLDSSMTSVGLEEVETYILRHHDTIPQYIATCLILELCLEEEQHKGERVTQRWWEQA